MSVKLRLVRMGKTKQPTYRVVAADSRSPRNGRFIELIGTYEPRRDPSVIKLDATKVEKWLKNGAQPTERVQKILVAEGLLTADAAAKTVVGKKATKRPAKQKTVKETPAPVAETKPQAESTQKAETKPQAESTPAATPEPAEAATEPAEAEAAE
jgi:small subunit ribosomal protein S16